jgi:hypothetical protein
LDVTIVDLCSCRLAEYFEKRFRRQHGRRLDIDRTGVVGKSGDGELVLWKECPLERMSALECGSRLSNFRSWVTTRNTQVEQIASAVHSEAGHSILAYFPRFRGSGTSANFLRYFTAFLL